MRNEELMKKWGPVLEHNALPGIKDGHRKAVTAQLLENTELIQDLHGRPRPFFPVNRQSHAKTEFLQLL